MDPRAKYMKPATLRDDADRGTGRTTRQLASAPPNAFFVWIDMGLYYPIMIAKKINRMDLTIVGPSFFNYGYWRGTTKPIILDHAFEWSAFDRATIESYFLHISRYNPTEENKKAIT